MTCLRTSKGDAEEVSTLSQVIRSLLPTREEIAAIEKEMEAYRQYASENAEVISGITDRFIIDNWDWPEIDRSWLYTKSDEPVEGS